MTQEDKELLLRDLCARSPYGVKCQGVTTSGGINTIGGHCSALGFYDFYIEEIEGWFDVSKIKPYLRPMSSMTEEEMEEYNQLWDDDRIDTIVTVGKRLEEEYKKKNYNSIWQHPVVPIYKYIDWLNTHHFDYRGLIEKGLAIEAPEGMYKQN